MLNLNKLLLNLLTKHIIELGLEKEFSDDGYLPLNTILNVEYIKSLNPSSEDIIDMLDKQQFTFKKVNNTYYIRSNDGHSKDVDKLLNHDKFLTRIYSFQEDNCIYETCTKDVNDIMEFGLNRMNKDYIYFTNDDSNSDILLYIDTEKAIQDGIEFYTSKSGLIVSPGNENGIIETKYIKTIVEY